MTHSIIQKSQLKGAQRIDAEYYQPEYLELIDNLNKIGAVPIRNIATNPKRKFCPKKDEYFNYIEISEVILSTGEYNKSKIIGSEAPDRAQWIVEKNDVILSTVRPIRNAISLINEDSSHLVCSSGFAVLKPKEIEPEYLFTYLKSKPIVKLLDRQTTATMYPAITAEDVLNTKIFLGNENFRNAIKDLIIDSQKKLGDSKKFIKQAEDLLLEELGLKDFDQGNDLFSIVQYGDVIIANRSDAEYFQPKFQRLFDILKTKNPKKLGELVLIKKGFEPGADEYQNEGKPFIRVSNLSKNGLIDGDQKYLNEDLYQKLKPEYQPEVGEILMTKDATPGIAYVLKEQIEGIISSGILRLIMKNQINLEYLSLVLNSIVGQMQAERDAGGSIIAHWKPEEIKNVVIPILPPSTQQKIADLVRQSHTARQKSKELLEEAKRKVEEMIEKGGE